MKKNILFKGFLFLICIVCVCFTLTGCKIESDENTPFTLKTHDTMYCENSSIKALSQSQDASASYLITPVGFDYDELNIKGYYMTITISYSVHYKKDTILPDFLYAGAPKYELTLFTSDLLGFQKSNLTTSETSTLKSYSYKVDFVDIKNSKIVLTFSTDNVQNVIYFTNIKITYNCYK